jgi:hypothetical protein
MSVTWKASRPPAAPDRQGILRARRRRSGSARNEKWTTYRHDEAAGAATGQPDGRWRTRRPDGTEILLAEPLPAELDQGRASSQGSSVSSGHCSTQRAALVS